MQISVMIHAIRSCGNAKKCHYIWTYQQHEETCVKEPYWKICNVGTCNKLYFNMIAWYWLEGNSFTFRINISSTACCLYRTWNGSGLMLLKFSYLPFSEVENLKLFCTFVPHLCFHACLFHSLLVKFKMENICLAALMV